MTLAKVLVSIWALASRGGVRYFLGPTFLNCPLGILPHFLFTPHLYRTSSCAKSSTGDLGHQELCSGEHLVLEIPSPSTWESPTLRVTAIELQFISGCKTCFDVLSSLPSHLPGCYPSLLHVLP